MGDYNISQSGHQEDFYDSEVDKNTFGSFFVVVTIIIMFSRMPPKFVKTLSHK